MVPSQSKTATWGFSSNTSRSSSSAVQPGISTCADVTLVQPHFEPIAAVWIPLQSISCASQKIIAIPTIFPQTGGFCLFVADERLTNASKCARFAAGLHAAMRLLF
jgi:hypothetical protein